MESLIADIVLQLLSYFAEDERCRIKTRQAEGIAVAKKNGRKFGRPGMAYPEEWEKYYSEWKAGNATAVETFTKLGLKKATFYKLVKNMRTGSDMRANMVSN